MQDNVMTVLYAHNFVETLTLDLETHETLKNSSKVICQEEQCILYSGDIDLARGLVAAGTVFRVLLIWQV